MMRCKFKVNEVTLVSSATPRGVRIKMGAVYSSEYTGTADKADENAIFGKFTPHGAFEATIYNDALYDKLVASVGKFFYLDFTEAQ